MALGISSFGFQLFATSNLTNQKSALEVLNEQLGSGQQHSNLTDYSPVEAHNLMDFQNAITQHNAYISAMKTVQTRLDIYDKTMTDMENMAAQAKSLASQNQSLDPTKQSGINAQAQTMLKQLTDDLNQMVGGRYLYAGSRYTTAPVSDLTNLSGAPSWPFTPTTTPTLPNYDSQYNPPTTTTSAASFTQEAVTIAPSFTLQYGVTSNDPAIQKLIGGLQYLTTAAQTSDPTTYQTNMLHATATLTDALTSIQAVHAGVAGNMNTIQSETSLHNADITSLQGQVSDIQQVDVAAVGTKLNLLESQLQASYSTTASLEQLSILKYL